MGVENQSSMKVQILFFILTSEDEVKIFLSTTDDSPMLDIGTEDAEVFS